MSVEVLNDAWRVAAEKEFEPVWRTDGTLDTALTPWGVAANIRYAWEGTAAKLGDLCEEPAVDYGCGTGDFALRKLWSERDLMVTAIDRSPAMIALAAKKVHGQLRLLVGAEETLAAQRDQRAVTANLVLNYLPCLERLADALDCCLHSRKGMFVFAELNPEYVRACLERGIVYERPDAAATPRACFLRFTQDSDPVAVTLRSAEEYDEQFSRAGLWRVGEPDAPQLENDFLGQIRSRLPHGYPEDIPRYRVYLYERRPCAGLLKTRDLA